MRASDLLDITLFALIAWVAYATGWQTNELCWGLWITSLLCGWLTILVSVARTLLHVTAVVPLAPADLIGDSPLGGFHRRKLAAKVPELTALIPQELRSGVLVAGALGIGLFVTFHFSMFHFIHGALMSVFVRIEPASLFGPNSYINADLGTILPHLIGAYWPMIVCTVISRRAVILAGNPGENLHGIYRSVIKMHLFILLSAALGFIGASYGKEAYDQITLGILLFFFFFPWRRRSAEPPFPPATAKSPSLRPPAVK